LKGIGVVLAGSLLKLQCEGLKNQLADNADEAEKIYNKCLEKQASKIKKAQQTSARNREKLKNQYLKD
jgi:hypothetical protein